MQITLFICEAMRWGRVFSKGILNVRISNRFFSLDILAQACIGIHMYWNTHVLAYTYIGIHTYIGKMVRWLFASYIGIHLHWHPFTLAFIFIGINILNVNKQAVFPTRLLACMLVCLVSGLWDPEYLINIWINKSCRKIIDCIEVLHYCATKMHSFCFQGGLGNHFVSCKLFLYFMRGEWVILSSFQDLSLFQDLSSIQSGPAGIAWSLLEGEWSCLYCIL